LIPSAITKPAQACDCFGNESYCETLSPNWYVNPVATALVVKLSNYHYGITVKVVQVIGSGSLNNDTLTVWGDNGALCRVSLGGFPVGDTLVLGLNQCDLWGNEIYNSQYPPDLEQPGDYMVSVCGIYWLNFENGHVIGPITAPVVQSMTVEEFAEVVQNCSVANGVVEPTGVDPLVVRYVDGTPELELPGPSGHVELLIIDPCGRMVIRRTWNGQRLRITNVAAGLYTAQVSLGGERWTRKLLVSR